ncbi:protein FAM24B [Carlito syrichta]|uniref:Protein FAM24B n=1 Tax=Carlito syrichta TaxID=1868482 RepID=A0A1U7SXY6_CARSF|nr:protein FAM24B [Carlito syrichta]
MFAIAGGILAALLLLTVVVLCLFIKVSKALKTAKEPDVEAAKGKNLDKAWYTKNARAKASTAESCPTLQCCTACRMHDFDALPPCYCDVNEGL